ncbi:MAG: riboflavin synthase subunit alpha [Deltaproteobacteria bacterium]|nr:riboflavin synthase subunit alpha [Deltaproteobacteria bacterium]
MFTGIVQGTAEVLEARDHDGLRTLVLVLPAGREEGLAVGASIAVGGVCLTVVGFQGRRVTFDCIEETLSRTTLSGLRVGDRVNIERAARLGDELGGHLVSGHVTATVPLRARTEEGGNLTLRFGVAPPHDRYVLSKGFLALDGCSLTVGEVSEGTFAVHLIPETRRVTTLEGLRVGDRANLELDAQTVAMVDTVERVLRARG